MEQETQAESVTDQTANPQVGADSSVSESQNESGQSDGQNETDSQEGLGNIDPKTLPPALKAVYDNLYRDYQKKTTSIAERVKAEVAKSVSGYKEKAEQFEQIVNNDEFVKMWNDYVEKSKSAQSNGRPVDEVSKKLQDIEVKLKTQESLEAINIFADAKDEKGEMLHPDFDRLSEIKIGTHSQSGEYDLLRAAIELAPGDSYMEKLENGYQAAKEVYDTIFEEGRKAGMGRMNDKVKNSTYAPSAGSSKLSSYAQKQPANALEALEMARKGLLPAQQ